MIEVVVVYVVVVVLGWRRNGSSVLEKVGWE